jgi:hypothetical protein
MLSTYLKCARCGQISQQTIDLFGAVWIWPLTLSIFVGLLYVLCMHLYSELQILYIPTSNRFMRPFIRCTSMWVQISPY